MTVIHSAYNKIKMITKKETWIKEDYGIMPIM